MDQNTFISKSAVRGTYIAGKVSTIFGWVVAISFLVTWFTVDSTPGNAVDIAPMCLTYIAVGVLLIINGKRKKDRLRRLEKYLSIIVNQNETSIDQIATMVKKPVNFVLKDMKFMIRKRYFVNAYIDQNTNSIVFPGRVASAAHNEIHEDSVPDSEMQVVTCKSCGAQNKIAKGSVGKCEYCGSLLSSN